MAYFWMVLGGGGPATIALFDWNADRRIGVAALTLAACAISGCYLGGPAARFVMTPEHLRIDKALSRVMVPRHLIAGFAQGPRTLTLLLAGGGHLDVRVDSPMLDMGRGSEYRTNIRAQLRGAEWIAAMSHEVPAAPGAGADVVAVPRRGMRALASASLVVAVGAAAVFGLAVRASS